MKDKAVKKDHMSYVSSILDCAEDELTITESTQKSLSLLQKFATLNFKDNSQAHLFLDTKGKKFINMKSAEGINLLITAND
jgi:hypothetical protein